MNYLSVCSGIEAFSVAVSDLTDWHPVAFAEIEPFPSAVLAHRFPHTPNLGDMTGIDVKKLGRVDWLVGGTPCQAFSTAGRRLGLKDARGNLTLAFVVLAHALKKTNGLRGLLWENVPGCLSDETNAFGCLLGGLVGHDAPLVTPDGKRWPDAGMASGPRARLAWRVLNSQHFGVAQRRRRVFLVADFGNGPDPAAVLFEPGGERWSPAPGREAGEAIAQGVAPSLRGGGPGDARTGDSRGQDPLIVTHALKAEGADGSEDGTGRGVPMVTVEVAPTLRAGGNMTGGHRPPGSDVDTIETLVTYLGNAEGGNPDTPSLSLSNTGKTVNNQTPLVAVFDPNQVTSKTNRSQPSPEVSHTLPATANAPVAFDWYSSESQTMPVMDDKSPPIKTTMQPAVAFSIRPTNSNKDYRADANDFAQAVTGNAGKPPSARGGDVVVETAAPVDLQNLRVGEGDTTGTLDTSRPSRGGGQAVMAHQQVRRLTPVECERLQGFPDNWTLIPGLTGWRDVGDDEDVRELEEAGFTIRRTKKSNKLRVNDPDGPRYKSLGNSFTTEPVNWIMTRVAASLAGLPMPDWQPMRLWQKGR